MNHKNENKMKGQTDIESSFLTIPQAANLIDVNERKIYYLMQKKALNYYCIPGTRKRYVKREELLGLLERVAA